MGRTAMEMAVMCNKEEIDDAKEKGMIAQQSHEYKRGQDRSTTLV